MQLKSIKRNLNADFKFANGFYVLILSALITMKICIKNVFKALKNP